MSETLALRGRVLSFNADPQLMGPAACDYIADGLVVMTAGHIAAVGAAAELLPRLPPGAKLEHYSQKLILPGFIDSHIHFPQTRVVGSYGTQLLEWLQKYTFPEEIKYSNLAHAQTAATFFFDELLRNGTTTAAAFCTSHPNSVEAFFTESERRGTRMIAGKVMMDRHAPAALTDDPQRGYDESKALLQRWHGRGRQLCAISPRFAITSTEAQLAAAGALAREFPDAYIQTHLSENEAEIALARSLFPQDPSYGAIYQRHGLMRRRALFGHCIHLGDDETRALGESGAVAVFCPTSNLFLGSGLFDLARMKRGAAPVKVALATDIGGGTSYSMLRTAAEAYKVLQMRGQSWPALAAFHQMTQGNAQALELDGKIGRIAPGYEADLVVLDARATPAMAHRMESVSGDLAEELFVLMTMGDDRNVAATYVAGTRAA